MAALTQVPVQVYDVRGDTITLPPSTVAQNRNPGVNDLAEVGSMWINYLNNNVFILTSTAGPAAVWTKISEGGVAGPIDSVDTDTGVVNPVGGVINIVGDGTNSEVQGVGDTATVVINPEPTFAIVTTDSLDVVAGDIDVTAGSITASNNITSVGGDITAVAGDVVVTAGDITVAMGDIAATLGSVSAGAAVIAGTTVTAGTDIVATTGDITASAGDITATIGDLVAGTGNVIANTGHVQADYFSFSVGEQTIKHGIGSPDGALVAPQGSLYLRSDGSGVNDRAYINIDGDDGWTAIVTVA